jgi:hypothetical protein
MRTLRSVVAASAAVIAAFGLSLTTFADGTEQLGPPVGVDIAIGTGVVVGGVGMRAFPNQPNSFNVNVPANATVKQVLLYWSGHWTNVTEPGFPQVDGDDAISINGIPVVGQKIGGSTNFFSAEMFVTYRADVTGLNLVAAGQSTLTINDMSFLSFYNGNDGAGVMVIYDDGGAPAHIDIRDGLDLAFAFFGAPLDKTVPQTFTFAASVADRSANLGTFASSVASATEGAVRPNGLVIAFAPVGGSFTIANPWQSLAGDEFDALNTPITIPAGATSRPTV